jgi:hypothetical protein
MNIILTNKKKIKLNYEFCLLLFRWMHLVKNEYQIRHRRVWFSRNRH